MSNPKKATTKAYESFVEKFLLTHEGVSAGSLFGMPCLKRDSKAFAGSYDGGLVVKLPAEAAAKATQVRGAILFDPSGKDRPMKGWIVLPKAAVKQWQRWGDLAFESL